MTPKDRVRANIYKTLLEEEKKKSRRKGVFSLSLFILGIFTSSTYQMLFKEAPVSSIDKYVINRSFNDNKASKEDITLEHIFNNSIFDDKKIDLNTDDLFGLEVQI